MRATVLPLPTLCVWVCPARAINLGPGRRTFTHRTVAHRTFTHRRVANRTVAHLILNAYLILKRVLLANSTFIWYFNANRTHGCVERIVSVTGSACLPVCDAVLPKRAAVNQPILLDFLFLYGSDPIIVYGP